MLVLKGKAIEMDQWTYDSRLESPQDRQCCFGRFHAVARSRQSLVRSGMRPSWPGGKPLMQCPGQLNGLFSSKIDQL